MRQIAWSVIRGLIVSILLLGCSPSPTIIVDIEEQDQWYEQESDEEDDSETSETPEPPATPESPESPESPDYWEELTESTTATISIAELKNRYVGSTQRITESLLISGVVTANNVLGEFPDAIIIEDASAAIELTIEDDYILSYGLTIGSAVTLILSDLYLSARGDVIIVGCAPTGNDLVDPISEVELQRRLTTSVMSSSLAPRTVKITELTPSLISCYICIEDLEFLPSGVSTQFCERDSDTGRYVSTNHTLEDASGNQINLYVPSTVDYAAETTPLGRGDVYCIVESFASSFSVRIVYYRLIF
ncbi:MAG: DUF5689 domain-containing protein [Rikenellaceae bacterium]